MSENEKQEEETQEEDESNEEESQEEEEQADEPEESSEEEDDESEWKARALKAEKLIAERKRKEKAQKKEAPKLEDPDDDLRSEVEQLKQTEQKRQFGYEHNLSPEEVDRVFKISSNPTEETLKDPFVKAGLEAIRKQKRVDENTPSSSAKTSALPRKKLNKLNQNEKNAEWQKFMKRKGVLK